MSRFKWRSFTTIRWSSKSRRQLPTQRSAMPFCHGLRKLVRLGWTPKTLYRIDHFVIELRAAVKDQEPGSRIERECLAQLLDDLIADWVLGHIAVQYPPPVMRNNEEAVECAKGERCRP
jgi:hypothetical protein